MTRDAMVPLRLLLCPLIIAIVCGRAVVLHRDASDAVTLYHRGTVTQ